MSLEPPQELLLLHERLRSCRLCQDAGYLHRARPVLTDWGMRRGMMLIGQAPGVVEFDNGTPFGGRAGRELFRWLASVGIEEMEFRHRVYMCAVTRCFPGKSPTGNGDRKPSRPEIELCRPWLESILRILEPRVLLLVGGLAIERYLPGRRLDSIVGRRYEHEDQILIPLPHPSGASRWLNAREHRELLRDGLRQVRDLWDTVVDPAPEEPAERLPAPATVVR